MQSIQSKSIFDCSVSCGWDFGGVWAMRTLALSLSQLCGHLFVINATIATMARMQRCAARQMQITGGLNIIKSKMATTSKLTTATEAATAASETKHRAEPSAQGLTADARRQRTLTLRMCVCVPRPDEYQLNYERCKALQLLQLPAASATRRLSKYSHVFRFYWHFLFATGQDLAKDMAGRGKAAETDGT